MRRCIMSTYTQIYYHITFSTKERRPTLDASRREDLFKYIWGVVRNHRTRLYRINGVADHIHLFTGLHPTVALADFIKDIKVASSAWVKENKVFPAFTHWQEGYGAFTVSARERNAVIDYVKRQVEHHQAVSFVDELRRLLVEADVKFDEKHLE
jgi:REP element-mobilizing transposase RayT